MIVLTPRVPFARHGFLAFDRDGHERVIAVVKATYTMDGHGGLTIADEQVPVFHVDQFRSAPTDSSIRYEADLAAFKPGVDLLIEGSAHARRATSQMTVTVETRYFRKQILVTGDRVWERGPLGLRPTAPTPFLSMPIVYERAYGGTATKDGQPVGAEVRNPVGRGFYAGQPPDSGAALPNIEDPGDRVSSWKDRPRPVGFGVVGRGWKPRIDFAGTYDERWQRERFPLLPTDFDDRHFLAAPPDQVLPRVSPGEPILLGGLTPDGELRIDLPALQVPVYARWNTRAERLQANLDTVLIEPDLRRVVLVSRVAIAIGRKPDKLREVIIGNLLPGEERAVLTGKRYLPLGQIATADGNGSES